MKKVLTIIIICVLFITTGVLAYTTYNLYQENQELQEDIDDLKDEKKATSNKNENNSNKGNANYKEENSNKDNVVVDNKKEETENDKQEEYSNIREINYTDLENMLLEKHSFILLVSQTGCSHCEAYRPVLNKVLKDNKITAYEIDLLKLTEEELKSFNKFAYVSGTPTTIFIKNGQEESTSNRLVGSGSSSDKIVSRLKAMGYIK